MLCVCVLLLRVCYDLLLGRKVCTALKKFSYDPDAPSHRFVRKIDSALGMSRDDPDLYSERQA